MMQGKLDGIVVAPITPMNRDLSVDWVGLEELVSFLISRGIDGLTACAVTAETEGLSMEEHRRVLERTVSVVGGRVPVYCGVGRTSILETRELVAFVEALGGDGLFVITPYASAYTGDEVVAYLRDIAMRSRLPLMMYNCPGYAGVNITVERITQLSQIDNVVAIKEGNQEQLPALVAATRGSAFKVFTARDSYLLDSLDGGAAGVISFAGNVAPDLLVDLYGAWRTGDRNRAEQLQASVTRLVGALVTRSYPLFIKAAMAELGLPAGPARRIEGGLDRAEQAAVRTCLNEVVGGWRYERPDRRAATVP
jgi:4-hydroxy-tetrahydrodipicolinate synthase